MRECMLFVLAVIVAGCFDFDADEQIADSDNDATESDVNNDTDTKTDSDSTSDEDSDSDTGDDGGVTCDCEVGSGPCCKSDCLFYTLEEEHICEATDHRYQCTSDACGAGVERQ